MINTCLSAQTLRDYQLGNYAVDEGSEIESHLSSCPECEQALAELDDVSDSLVRHLPLTVGQDDVADVSSPGWLRRLQAGPPSPVEGPVPVATDDFVIEGLESYELLGVLGKGGMGIVYRARHRHLHRQVAVKIVSPRLVSAAEARRRFEREIRILGELRHPGIVMATDAGRVGPAAYLVMELIDGVDLSRLVKQLGPLGIAAACEVARQAALALAAAHDSGAIHRDVKPSNVMIDAQGRVKLLDFGLAHLADLAGEHSETSLGRMLGTLDYMSPEQAEGGPVTPAADLYSLGATLFFLLTGRPPHRASRQQSLLQQLRSISTAEAPALRELRGDVPEGLNELVTRLLSRDPSQRPASAAEVAERLSSILIQMTVIDGTTSGDSGTHAPAPSLSGRGRNGGRDVAAQLAALVAENRQLAGDNGSDEREAEVATSLSQLLGQAVPTSGAFARAEDKVPATVATSSRRKSRFRWLLALAGLLGFTAWGIVLLVETPEGTLRIESEAADVQVELVAEDQAVTPLRIEGGAGETTLRAGTYRIRLKGGHDSLLLDKDVIVLKRGEEAVARVTRLPPSADRPAGLAGAEPGQRDEPLYQGKPLSYWRDRFTHETDINAKIDAAIALASTLPTTDPLLTVNGVISLGADVVRTGWRNDLEDAPFHAITSTIVAVPISYKETSLKWRDFEEIVDRQLMSVPETSAAHILVGAVKSEDLALRAFAISLLNSEGRVASLPSRLKAHTKAVDTIMSGLDIEDTIALDSIPGVFVRLQYVGGATDSARRELEADFAACGSVLASAIEGRPFTGQSHPIVTIQLLWQWIEGTRHVNADAELISRLMLAMVSSREFDVKYLVSRTLSIDDQKTRRPIPFHSKWCEVAGKWLREQPTVENFPAVSRVVAFTAEVLRQRRPDEQWPLDELSAILSRHLDAALTWMDAASDEMRAADYGGKLVYELVRSILLCKGELPPQVKAESQLSPRAKAELERFKEGMALRNGIRQADISRLGRLYPYFTVRLTVDSHSVFPTFRRNFQSQESWDGLDAILMLAILADLTGESESRQSGIARTLEPVSELKSWYQLIANDLSSEFAIRNITLDFLLQMFSKSKNEELRGRVLSLVPALKRESPQFEAPAGRIDDGNSQVPPTSPEAFYQGKPHAEWQRQFAGETDPKSKLDAAVALVSMTAALPVEQRFASILDIGESLVRDGWGEAAVGGNLRDVGSAYLTSVRWPHEYELFQQWEELHKNIGGELGIVPIDELVRSINQAAAGENIPRATFAIDLLYGDHFQNRLLEQPEPLQLLQDGLKRDAPQSLAWECLLMRAKYLRRGFDAQRIALVPEMEAMGRTLLEGKFSEEIKSDLKRWIQMTRYVPVNPQLAADVVLKGITTNTINPTDAFELSHYDGSFSLAVGRQGLIQALNDEIRVDNRSNYNGWLPHMNRWVDTASLWLSSPAAQGSVYQTWDVAHTAVFALRLRRNTDDWTLDRARNAFLKNLQQVQARAVDAPVSESELATGEVLRSQLMLGILLCDGELPENAISDDPPATLQDQLAQLMSNTPSPRREPLRDLFSRSPGNLTVLIVRSPQLTTRFFEYLIQRPTPPLGQVSRSRRLLAAEPLLLLATLAALTGENAEQDDRIALWLREDAYTALLRGELQDMLASTYCVRDISEKFLRRMHQKSRSEKLKSELAKLLPAPAENPNGQVEIINEDSGMGRVASPEPLYQGKTRSEWRSLFQRETDPLAKMQAGMALVSLSSALPVAERFPAIVDVGGTLVNDGWGPQAAELAFRRVSLQTPLDPVRWPEPPPGNEPKVRDAWRAFLNVVDAQLQTLPADLLGRQLVETVSQKHVPRAAFALIAGFSTGGNTQDWRITRLIQDPNVGPVLLENLRHDENAKLSQTCKLIRWWFSRFATADLSPQLRTELGDFAASVLERGLTEENELLFATWLATAADSFPEPRTNAQVVLRALLDRPEATLNEGFGRHGAGGSVRRPYFSAYLSRTLSDSRAFRDDWLAVTNSWLRDQLSQSPGVASRTAMKPVVESILLLLRSRQPEDKWPVQETAEIFRTFVGQFYVADAGQSVAAGHQHADPLTCADLLTGILLCGEPLPEFVTSGLPADVDDREKLDVLQQLVQSRRLTDSQILSQKLEGLIQRHPLHVVRIVTAGQFMDAMQGLFELAYPNQGFAENLQPPPLPPLLLLACLEEVAGPDTNVQKAIDNGLNAPQTGEFLRFHVTNMVEGFEPVRSIAIRLLQGIRTKVDNQQLIRRIDGYLPPADRSAD